jgi:hypothetical protein
MQILLWLLLVVEYVGLPAVLIAGWSRLLRHPGHPGGLAKVSLIGFLLGSASALLAVGSQLYAHWIGGFQYYDPPLLRIYRIGLLLSLCGLICAAIGAFRRNALRWYAPALSFGMFVLWFMWAVGE